LDFSGRFDSCGVGYGRFLLLPHSIFLRRLLGVFRCSLLCCYFPRFLLVVFDFVAVGAIGIFWACASLEIRVWALRWFRLDISGGWIRLFWASSSSCCLGLGYFLASSGQ